MAYNTPSCLQKGATFWAPFNGEDDRASVFAQDETIAATEIELTSSTASVVVGTAVVEPGGAPLARTIG